MKDELSRFHATLREQGVPAAVRLRPGRPRDDVVAAGAALGLTVADDVVDWFEWCDGAEFDATVLDSDLLVPGYAPLRLERAAEAHGDVVRALVDESPWPVAQARRWLPFAAAQHGDLLAASCEGGATSPVVWIQFEADEQHAVVAASMAELVERWIAAYERGTFAVGNDGRLSAPPGASPVAR